MNPAERLANTAHRLAVKAGRELHLTRSEEFSIIRRKERLLSQDWRRLSEEKREKRLRGLWEELIWTGKLLGWDVEKEGRG